MLTLRRHVAWLIVAVLGAFALATVALSRGEAVSALWIVVAAVCVYLIAYRYYSLFLAQRVLGLDANRQTPAWAHNDGLDYVPTNKVVLYGHHSVGRDARMAHRHIFGQDRVRARTSHPPTGGFRAGIRAGPIRES